MYNYLTWDLPGGTVVKNLPAMQEMWVQSVGPEDPLEKEIPTHSSILAWEISWIQEPGRLQSMGSQVTGASTHLHTQSMHLTWTKLLIVTF